MGETVSLWVWAVGVEPGAWDLVVDGTGAVSLSGAREIDSWAEFVEWSVTGARKGEVTFSVGMTCREPGDGTDSLTLTVLPDEPRPTPTPQASAGFCATSLSLSHGEVRVGDDFYAWFAGAGAEPRSWRLSMEGDGSARVITSRELDAEYVEWQLQAMKAGSVRLVAEMNCRQAGDGVSDGEIVIADETGHLAASWKERFWTPRTVAMIEASLVVVAVTLIAVLVYLLIRRRR